MTPDLWIGWAVIAVVAFVVWVVWNARSTLASLKLPRRAKEKAATATTEEKAPAKEKKKKKLPWWITLPVCVVLLGLALLAVRWVWEFSPDQLKQVPSVSGGGSAAATRPALASFRCLGQDTAIAVIAPGQSIYVSLDAGRTMETYPSSPDLVIEAAGNPSLSTRNGGHLDAASNFFRVHSVRQGDGLPFYFSCEYR
jgi:hypothetical protein